MQVPELTRAFNEAFGLAKTEQQIRATLKNHRMTCGRPPGSPKGTYRLFTAEQADLIRDLYKKHDPAGVAMRINEQFGTEFTARHIRSFAKNHKVKSGRTGRFQKGHAPANKGVKGWQAGGRSKETQFQKGRQAHENHNYRPIGSTRITRDGYIERKVSDDRNLVPARRWECEHRLVWAAAYGPIPEGHVVVFLDGDKLNCALDNLRCVPRSVLQYLNKVGLNETTGEARKSAILMSEVMATAKKMERDAAA